MTTTLGQPLTTTPTSTFMVASTASPLTILLHDRLKATEDFFPFQDLAKLKGMSKADLTFRNLINDGIDGGPEIDLYESGCKLNNGMADCNIACRDPVLFYGSLDTFYNCAALSSISHYARDLGYYRLTPEAERNASSIMGPGSLAAFEGRPVLQSFVSCALDSCNNDHLSLGCNDTVKSLTKDTPTQDIFDAMDDFCPSLSAEINPDIFGPGVSSLTFT